MVFSSFTFLFYFLPLVAALYALAPKSLRNTVLVLTSVFYFAWSDPVFIWPLLLFCGLDYTLARGIGASTGRTAKALLVLSLSINIGALCYFKYANFFVGEADRLLAALGYSQIAWTRVALPIGISFFTFHKISYVVDVYRRICPPCKNPIDFCLYILFFPQLICGPIIRYHEIEQQLHSRRVGLDDLFAGLVRFCCGLGKKVLIADVAGNTADNAFALSANELWPEYAWIGLLAYTVQIYYDFSGYSDMAIGLARLFGFHFPENFDNPYIARNFTDFWRRWHMSFGRWMREYLYYPLGGNRRGVLRGYFNLWVVFLFSGLWHGAQWTFILWGVWHGVFMTLEKLGLEKITRRFPVVVQVGITLLLVTLSRVLFRAENLSQADYYFRRLVSNEGCIPSLPLASITSNHELFIIALGYLLCFWPLWPRAARCYDWVRSNFRPVFMTTVDGIMALLLLFLSVTALAGRDFSPFIYFQF